MKLIVDSLEPSATTIRIVDFCHGVMPATLTITTHEGNAVMPSLLIDTIGGRYLFPWGMRLCSGQYRIHISGDGFSASAIGIVAPIVGFSRGGSGVFIHIDGRLYILTNHHVCPSRKLAELETVTFISSREPVHLDANAFFATCEKPLDATLVGVKPGCYSEAPISISPSSDFRGPDAFLVHAPRTHPTLVQTRLEMKGFQTPTISRPKISYHYDGIRSCGGSSGGAVFGMKKDSSEFALQGLHCGFGYGVSTECIMEAMRNKGL